MSFLIVSTMRQADKLPVSPLSFSTRIAGKDRSWLLYKVANGVTNQLKSLVVKNVPANGKC